MQDRCRDRLELVDRCLEQLIARVGLEDLDEVLAAVTARRVTGAGQDLLDLSAQDGDPLHALGVRR